LGAGLTIQPWKKVIVTKPHQRGGQGPDWAVEMYDDDDDDLKTRKFNERESEYCSRS
jgi:hypothetical protein